MDYTLKLQEILNLKRNGATCTTTIESYRCDKCKDLEYTIETINNRDIAVPCTCKAERDFERALKYSGISDEFKSKGFKNFIETEQNSKIKAFCKRYYKEQAYKNSSLVITGNVGSGKTHLAMAVSNCLLADGIQVVYIDYRSFITKIKQDLIDKDSYQSEMQRLVNADILFIDDLYKGNTTKADYNVMFELINSRYLAKKQMLITSELSMEKIIDNDEGIGSRIRQMAKDWTFRNTAPNYRLI